MLHFDWLIVFLNLLSVYLLNILFVSFCTNHVFTFYISLDSIIVYEK